MLAFFKNFPSDGKNYKILSIYRKRRYKMAKNPPKDSSRKGAVRDRSQFQNPKTQLWTKRDQATGQFLDVKTTGSRFKGVRKEK